MYNSLPCLTGGLSIRIPNQYTKVEKLSKNLSYHSYYHKLKILLQSIYSPLPLIAHIPAPYFVMSSTSLYCQFSLPKNTLAPNQFNDFQNKEIDIEY